MILIFSKSWSEITTESVIEWLNTLNVQFTRINGDFFKKRIDLINGDFKDLDKLFLEANICWFRRWSEPKDSEKLLKKASLSNYNYRVLNNFLNKEAILYSNYLWYKLRNVEWLSDPNTEVKLPKLEVLEQARQVGLTSPETLITSSKESLLKFYENHQRLISKPISDPVLFISDNVGAFIKTIEVTIEDINQMPNEFSLSLFQNLIEKEIELRVFYLDDQFYSMAIFSQLDNQTEIDFRNYNHEKPNRTVPYLLPKEVENKLRMLVKRLNLTTGSFDLIKDKNGEYIFLEVNPVGQFGMVSHPCNYFLEKKVAKYLAKRDKENERI
jgi:ATP-GRASP peptide maturase of grasp-with-spasm system